MRGFANFVTVAATLICCAASATMAAFNVKCAIDHDARTMTVQSVNDKPVSIYVIPPNADTNGDDTLTTLHQFPGVASSVVFPPISRDDELLVELSNGVLYKIRASLVYTNFHTHKNRMVYGQLLTIAIDDFAVASKVYVGAPIYRGGELVSVITCRFDDYQKGLALFPVTGVRPKGLASGQMMFDDRVIVKTLAAGVSVYGRQQLPYNSVHMSVKQFAMAATVNRNMYRDLPRCVIVFHNDTEIIITMVEGEFEMYRVRLDGPLVTNQQQ
ncbi:p26-b [Alphabaculovirus altersperidaniae]|uniref:P26-b n=1 Tax=Spodoptera eridania nucleopolyhedrovirus TaxID=2315721 RepID=A0ABX6TRT5_9ABAC|nr:p26-b [Spodoptera eridania nucleopolyhedrovirus]QNV47846.1 p26-b [Spodoptera eridania nucleopolyhedrovirus]